MMFNLIFILIVFIKKIKISTKQRKHTRQTNVVNVIQHTLSMLKQMELNEIGVYHFFSARITISPLFVAKSVA